MNRPERVVITGIGLKTGLGFGREATWNSIREGRHAFAVLDVPAGSEIAPHVGAPITECGRSVAGLGLAAAWEAWRHARLDEHPLDRTRIATVLGISKPELDLWSRFRDDPEAEFRLLQDDGTRGFRSDLGMNWSGSWPDAASVAVASFLNLQGPCLAPIAACATGLVAALQAADLIRRGVCDVALAGASDVSLNPLILGAFRRMGVLAGVGDDPSRALRPWDRDRSGFLVGEGAAVLVLERADHARARGARPFAEFAGGAFGSDAYHMTNLNPDPKGLADLIKRALERSGVSPDEIDHVNVHGTATRSNDPLECRALRLALGTQADRVSCSANKAQIGHLLGAAGAVELALTCLALRDQFVPPTLNLDDPDPACDLDGTPHVGRARPIRAALKLSIGFGGHLAAAVLRRADGARS